MVEDIEFGFIGCRQSPRFATPEEGGEDAGFIDHSFSPHLHFGAAPEEAKSSHYLGGFKDTASDVGAIL